VGGEKYKLRILQSTTGGVKKKPFHQKLRKKPTKGPRKG
jgi:hypothetical protein